MDDRRREIVEKLSATRSVAHVDSLLDDLFESLRDEDHAKARAEGERAGRAKAFEDAADLVDERWKYGQAFIVNALLVKAGKEPEPE